MLFFELASIQVTSGVSCKRADYQLHLAPTFSLKCIKGPLGYVVAGWHWQETLDAVKLSSSPLTEHTHTHPHTLVSYVWGGEVEYSFPGILQIHPMWVSLHSPVIWKEPGGWAAAEKSVLSHPQHNCSSHILNRLHLAVPQSTHQCAFWDRTLPPDQDTVFASRLLAVSPLLGGRWSKLMAAWVQPQRVALAAVGTGCRIGPSSAYCCKDIHSPKGVSGEWQMPAVPLPCTAAITASHWPHLEEEASNFPFLFAGVTMAKLHTQAWRWNMHWKYMLKKVKKSPGLIWGVNLIKKASCCLGKWYQR